jgi:hypothetical protein
MASLEKKDSQNTVFLRRVTQEPVELRRAWREVGISERGAPGVCQHEWQSPSPGARAQSQRSDEEQLNYLLGGERACGRVEKSGSGAFDRPGG